MAAVGGGVNGVRVGDRVTDTAPRSFAQHAMADDRHLFEISEGVGYHGGAAPPTGC
jgi:hypothetical protein